ncbi:sterol desaturase [Solitalea longa]|uniref:Sterol desaturase n=1 Tax=Solitalea longa TaxID=2079460 RepID=A0A2S5A2T9_9SPHI|nr:sterol desaturase family protein [Solitalea longa]POY36602.1 sterol desaturase [Solitalea longa]
METLKLIFDHLNGWGLTVILLVTGLAEFSLGLYRNWKLNEKLTDLSSLLFGRLIFPVFLSYFALKFFPSVIPQYKDVLSWVPFWWGFFILCIADDLTQYWYHRLHHEVEWLWRFHRTHHSAPYMGMAMASRQNFIYTLLFPQIYVTITLTFLGLGLPALFVRGIKGVITTMAHSSIKWDKPLYTIKWLHPVAWVLERTISLPATHHAHHAAHEHDGIGHYHGNYGNMFFLWDVLFRTAKITRKYPEEYGLEDYPEDPWYAQVLYPLIKSNKEGSDLAK